MAKVYVVINHEPLTTRMEALDMGEVPKIYATRELAEAAAEEYNEEFNDPEPATVAEVEVIETATAVGV